MKKLSALNILFCLLLTSHLALASQKELLRSLLDEYTFVMTVEWDQRDLKFAHTQNQKLQNDLRSLIKEGLTLEEMKSVFSYYSNANIDQLETELRLINFKNPRALEKFVKDKIMKGYAQGASWAGDVVIFAGPAILLTAIILMIVNDGESSSTSSFAGICLEYGKSSCQLICDGDVCEEVCTDECLRYSN
jgi:hypothetical protein